MNAESEAKALKQRFLAVKNREDFARTYGVPGGGAMIYQHINHLKPISIEAAIAYAKGFSCSVAEISRSAADTLNKAPGDDATPAEIAHAFETGSPGKREALTLLARLPDDEAEAILPLIRSILSKYE